MVEHPQPSLDLMPARQSHAHLRKIDIGKVRDAIEIRLQPGSGFTIILTEVHHLHRRCHEFLEELFIGIVLGILSADVGRDQMGQDSIGKGV